MARARRVRRSVDTKPALKMEVARFRAALNAQCQRTYSLERTNKKLYESLNAGRALVRKATNCWPCSDPKCGLCEWIGETRLLIAEYAVQNLYTRRLSEKQAHLLECHLGEPPTT